MGALKEEVVVKSPIISKETLNEMAAFFMKTSIPRIMAEERKKESNY